MSSESLARQAVVACEATDAAAGIVAHDPQNVPETPSGRMRGDCPTLARRVLFAEDDPAVRLLITAVLVSEGSLVDGTTNGGEALERFRSDLYDLVVTDPSMPELQGDEPTQPIKDMSPATPVLMCTGADRPDLPISGRSIAVDDLLRKSLCRNTFVSSVRSLLQA